MFRAFDVKFVMRVHDELQLHFDETVVPDFLEASAVPWKSVERLYDALAIVADAKNTKRGVIANAVIVFPETVPDKEIRKRLLNLLGRLSSIIGNFTSKTSTRLNLSAEQCLLN